MTRQPLSELFADAVSPPRGKPVGDYEGTAQQATGTDATKQEVARLRSQVDTLTKALEACEFFIVECGVNGASQVLAMARAALKEPR